MSTKNKQLEIWESNAEKSSFREYSFDTVSGENIDLLYYPEDISDSYLEKLNFPGQFPYTRGIHPNLYRGKLWTMRQFAGFGSPEQTNKRFKYLLSQGQGGLSVAVSYTHLRAHET